MSETPIELLKTPRRVDWKYEFEFVREGQKIVLEGRGFPNAVYTGRISIGSAPSLQRIPTFIYEKEEGVEEVAVHRLGPGFIAYERIPISKKSQEMWDAL